ncbi:hypothetical protein V8E51_002837 [Hyaloscypha variabilis]
MVGYSLYCVWERNMAYKNSMRSNAILIRPSNSSTIIPDEKEQEHTDPIILFPTRPKLPPPLLPVHFSISPALLIPIKLSTLLSRRGIHRRRRRALRIPTTSIHLLSLWRVIHPTPRPIPSRHLHTRSRRCPTLSIHHRPNLLLSTNLPQPRPLLRLPLLTPIIADRDHDHDDQDDGAGDDADYAAAAGDVFVVVVVVCHDGSGEGA